MFPCDRHQRYVQLSTGERQSRGPISSERYEDTQALSLSLGRGGETPAALGGGEGSNTLRSER